MNRKDVLTKRMQRLAAKKDELVKRSDASTEIAEVRSINEQLTGINEDIADTQAELDAIDAEERSKAPAGAAAGTAAVQVRGGTPAASYSQNGTPAAENKDSISPEMRSRLAFANFVTRGIPMNAEVRADAFTNTTNTATAIPENLVQSIIEQIDAVGMILPLLTKTSYPVGQKISVDSVKPVASWVNEGAGSDAQAKGTLGSIVFAAFKLRCEIGMTQEVTVQTIAAFEALFIRQVSEAMVKAIESKVVSDDDGSDCPTGILYRSSGSDATIEVAKLATGHLTYKLLCDAEGLLPQQYENGAKWFMSKNTFMQFIAMTDSAGQPIARINYGIAGKAERTLLGREVILTGDYMSNYTEAAATADVCFAFLFDPSKYVLNTSYDLGIQSKVDWDTENHLTKAVMSVDGKVIERNSIVKLVKKYA